MATTGINQGETQRRRLPKLSTSNPPGISSDETPRTARSDDSARQRRRNQQQVTRQQTPTGRETSSPPTVKQFIFKYTNEFF